ncbi:hypothetical protein BA766_21475 [Stenotrophomonas maltophilia]|uniref:hypothetical protein n=1 Tax=Stenotrophomonas maltophilia TaxID=40324 RepID=UPI0008103915|nr:hypothetical protein [Stenotrophomonas maltophilia]OCK48074.1 hypothetical protein BA766_21475 [Stenotrophomonas maltophilia]
MPDPQIRIASQLLSGYVHQEPGKTPAEEDSDIDRALRIAAKMIVRRNGNFVTLKHEPPAPTRQYRTKDKVVDREVLPPLNTLLSERRAKESKSVASAKAGSHKPTLH